MSLTIPVLESWTWPWPIWTLNLVYLACGLVIAVHYVPLLQRVWRFPVAAATVYSLPTWSVWTPCRAIAFVYGLLVVRELAFLLVMGADLFGRLAVAALIVRARVLASGIRLYPYVP
jgi:hypothetical protein